MGHGRSAGRRSQGSYGFATRSRANRLTAASLIATEPSRRVGSNVIRPSKHHDCHHCRRLRPPDWRANERGARVAGRALARSAERVAAGRRERGLPDKALLDHIPSLIREIADVPGSTGRRRVRRQHVRARQGARARRAALRATGVRPPAAARVPGARRPSWSRSSSRRRAGWTSSRRRRSSPCWAGVAQAVGVLQQTTVETFIAKYTAQIDEQTRRLENFNRMVSHELRQPIGALQFAVKLADASDGPAGARRISGGHRSQPDAAGAADRPARDDVAAEDEHATTRRPSTCRSSSSRAKWRGSCATWPIGGTWRSGSPATCRSSRSTSRPWS